MADGSEPRVDANRKMIARANGTNATMSCGSTGSAK